MKRRGYLLGVVFLLGLLLVGCSKAANNKTILTTTNAYYEPTKKIVGHHYQVKSIVSSVNVDPHSYSPSADVSKDVAKSDLIISNGAGYDDWINKIVEANNKQDDILNYSADVLHHKNGANEHVWFIVDGMKKLSKVIYQRVSDLDDLNKTDYRKNYQSYDKKLNKLLVKEQQIKQKYSGKRAFVTEPLPDYLLSDLGITVADNHFAKAIEDGNDPSIKDVKAIQDGLKNHDVDLLVVNKQVSSTVVKNLIKVAKDNQVPIVYLTETIPNKVGYYNWMDKNLDTIDNALQGK